MKYSHKIDCDKIEERIPVYGDLFIWLDNEREKSYGVCLYSYNGLVSLKNPASTWDCNDNFIKEHIEKGEIKYLKTGESVTLTQE